MALIRLPVQAAQEAAADDTDSDQGGARPRKKRKRKGKLGKLPQPQQQTSMFQDLA